MRTTYVYNDKTGRMVKKRQPKSRSGHSVIPDEMDSMIHPCSGKRYTSKAKFRADTRAYGCTEVGNETIPDRVAERRQMPGGLRDEIVRQFSDW